MTESFAVVSVENSQRVILNDNHGVAPPEEWICASGPKATWFCIQGYAKKYGIKPSQVGWACRPLKESK
jgi:hypothetical protein